MKTLDFSAKNLDNQQNVVKEEIRVNVKNQPYGGFMWIDISRLAFDKWDNNHDGYGSFKDLETPAWTTCADFHGAYYRPTNAVLAIAGDVTPAAGLRAGAEVFRQPCRARDCRRGRTSPSR